MSGPAQHPHEEDLVLHYYGEPTELDVAAHLGSCAACGAAWDALRAGLDAVRDEEPAPLDAGRVWERLAPQLAAARRRTWPRLVLPSLAAAAALVLAFQVGRHWPAALPAPSAAPPTADAAARERVLLVAVGDHLERTQVLLIELANATDAQGRDIGKEQHQALELVGDNRLYRQAAVRAGQPGVASVLDELERVLVEVAHGPDRLEPSELAQLQKRIESRGLLFKVRVLESRVRQKPAPKKEAPAGGATVS